MEEVRKGSKKEKVNREKEPEMEGGFDEEPEEERRYWQQDLEEKDY